MRPRACEPRTAFFLVAGLRTSGSSPDSTWTSDNLREGVLRPDVYHPALTYFYVILDVFSSLRGGLYGGPPRERPIAG